MEDLETPVPKSAGRYAVTVEGLDPYHAGTAYFDTTSTELPIGSRYAAIPMTRIASRPSRRIQDEKDNKRYCIGFLLIVEPTGSGDIDEYRRIGLARV